MPTQNYTTSIAATKTVGEIQSALAQHGARRIAVEYEDGKPVGLAFELATTHGSQVFALPVDIRAVERLLLSQRQRNSRVTATPEQAVRVAWRTMKDWILAQLAIVEAQMVTMDQIMFPYLVVDQAAGRTMFDVYCDSTTGSVSELTAR